jgi:hypothetical protein
MLSRHDIHDARVIRYVPVFMFYVSLTPDKPDSPALMTTPYLLDYQQRGAHCLAFAKYADDFLPTRDRSLAGGDLFTFKVANADVRMSEIWPADGDSRCKLRRFQCLAFGEVGSMTRLVRCHGP